MMYKHDYEVFSLLVHVQSAIYGMQIKAALDEVNERYFVGYLHAECPVVPYIFGMYEVVVFAAEYKQVSHVGPQHRVDETFPEAFSEFGAI